MNIAWSGVTRPLERGKGMKIKNKLGRAAGIAVATAGIVGLNLPGTASAATAQPAALPVCTIQTFNGNYLTAVDGGGHTKDAVRTTATRAGAWEKFTLVPVAGDNLHYGLRTSNGNYLTAVGGGGRATDAIHSDATVLSTWEKFRFFARPDVIQVIDGHFLTAVGGGGRTTDAVHTDATVVDSWELFTITCAQ